MFMVVTKLEIAVYLHPLPTFLREIQNSNLPQKWDWSIMGEDSADSSRNINNERLVDRGFFRRFQKTQRKKLQTQFFQKKIKAYFRKTQQLVSCLNIISDTVLSWSRFWHSNSFKIIKKKFRKKLKLLRKISFFWKYSSFLWKNNSEKLMLPLTKLNIKLKKLIVQPSTYLL